MEKKINTSTLASNTELQKREDFLKLFKNCPIAENELLSNLGLFVKRQDFSKYLFFNEIYQKIKNNHGVIIEFGTRWGQNLVTLSNLRSIYEPYNYNRKIIGFDSFEGFININEKDGQNDIIKEGAFSVTSNFEQYLDQILTYHQSESPLSHIKKFEIRKGDAGIEFEKYLEENPQTIIAFAYFDFDIYEPTFKCLQLMKNHIAKGTIIGFDELNDPKFPGETLALKEVLGLQNVKINRNIFSGMQSYIEIE
jgi:hypothetical protein